jgi:hypothetical protein
MVFLTWIQLDHASMLQLPRNVSIVKLTEITAASLLARAAVRVLNPGTLALASQQLAVKGRGPTLR